MRTAFLVASPTGQEAQLARSNVIIRKVRLNLQQAHEGTPLPALSINSKTKIRGETL
jgi:hypothetical protein